MDNCEAKGQRSSLADYDWEANWVQKWVLNQCYCELILP